jgi:hypothetical protein
MFLFRLNFIPFVALLIFGTVACDLKVRVEPINISDKDASLSLDFTVS